MTALLGKAGKKVFEKHLEQYSPADPLYEYYTNDRGKKKRRKRELPPGLSARDAAILRSVKKRAHYLDKGFHLCGMRFGWTFVIGLIPVVGDVTDAALNYLLVVRKARKADLPDWLVGRMLLNNAVSAGVGFVPLVGDLILAVYKANSRNAALLEEYLRIRGEEFLKMGVTAVPAVEAGKASQSKKGGKKRDTQIASPTDIEQIKPGSGMTGPEMKQAIEEGPAELLAPSPSTSDHSTPSRPGKSSSPDSVSSKFSFFKRSKKPSTSTPPDKGRFVENLEIPPT